MNEQTVILTEAAPVERAPVSFGAAVKAARESIGMSSSALAARLRLSVKQIDALERCDLRALPSIIYVRGFLRGCARELKIDPAPLLADLERRAGVQTGKPAAPEAGGIPWHRFGDGSRPIIVIALGALVVAGVIGLLIPRQANAPSGRAASAAPARAPAPANPPAPAAAPSATASPPEMDALLAAPPPPRASAAPAEGQPGTTAPAAETRGTPKPEAQKATAAPAATQVARTDAELPVLVVRAHTQAWVEVTQADGTTVFSQICAPGSVQSIKAPPPLHLTVGNASDVEAEFRGAAVDLSRNLTPNGVARVTLQ
jgi:cytoskeleton protein RodZ